MKKTIALSALWLAPLAGSAQCRIHVKTDDFTGKTAAWTEKVRITHGGVPVLLKSHGDGCRYKVYFWLLQVDGRLFMAVSEDSDDCVCAVGSVELKFSDTEVLSKQIYRQGETVRTSLGEERVSLFELTAAELNRLASGRVSKFRLTEPGCSDHPVLEEMMPTEIAEKIIAASACMLEHFRK